METMAEHLIPKDDATDDTEQHKKIQRFAQKHEGRLHHHENGEAILLVKYAGIVRRLQKKNILSYFK